jgi:MFS family permease
MSPSQWGLVQSIFTVGGFFGALMCGPVATKYGRLLAMQATTLVFIVGPLASALANSIELMILGRFLSGIGAGASTVVCPMYVAEVSPPDKRGLFGAFTQVMINIGVLIAQLLGYFLSTNNLWRVILAAAALIGALELIGLHSIPESPKWLGDNAFTAVARRVSQSIGADLETEANMAGTLSSFSCPTSILETNRASARKGFGDHEQEPLLGVPAPTWTGPPRGPSVSLLEALREPIYRRAVVAVIAAMFAQQATGINCVVMYSVEILGAALPSGAVLITVIVSAVNVLVTIMCAPLADKIGRKPCLLLSISGIGTGSLLLAMGLINKVPGLSVFATFLFVTSFGVGLGPVPFILASELVDSEAFGAVQSWGLTACWLANFSVAQFFPMLDAALPQGHVFWVFVVIAIAIGSFIAWWVPESNGKATTAEVWGDK